MQPESIDTFENGEARLDVHKFEDPLKVCYWLTAGTGSIKYSEEGFCQLIELLKEYDSELNPPKKSLRIRDPWQFWTIIVAVLTLAVCIAIVL